jgi:hypothetical protein
MSGMVETLTPQELEAVRRFRDEVLRELARFASDQDDRTAAEQYILYARDFVASLPLDIAELAADPVWRKKWRREEERPAESC